MSVPIRGCQSCVCFPGFQPHKAVSSAYKLTWHSFHDLAEVIIKCRPWNTNTRVLSWWYFATTTKTLNTHSYPEPCPADSRKRFQALHLNWLASRSVYSCYRWSDSHELTNGLTDSFSSVIMTLSASQATHYAAYLGCHYILQLKPGHSTCHDLEGILVKLLYLTYMYGHLFKVVCPDFDWSIQVISYSTLLVLRAIEAIMQSLVLGFSALLLDSTCTCGLGELIEIIKIMMDLFSTWQDMFKAYCTNCVQLTHRQSH